MWSVAARAGGQSLDMEQELGDRVRASAEFREGVAAFREKRRPRYD